MDRFSKIILTIVVVTLLFLVLSGCAMAPLTGPGSARNKCIVEQGGDWVVKHVRWGWESEWKYNQMIKVWAPHYIMGCSHK